MMSKLSHEFECDFEALRYKYVQEDVIKGIRLLALTSGEFATLAALLIVSIEKTSVIREGITALRLPITTSILILIFKRNSHKTTKFYTLLNREERYAIRVALAFLGIPSLLFK